MKKGSEEFSEKNCNMFTIKCLLVTTLILYTTWVLNLLNIFVLDSQIFLIAVMGTTILSIIEIGIYYLLDLTKSYIKYLLLLIAVFVYSFITSCLTYHATISLIFPIVYSAMYRKKNVIWYTYAITAIGIVCSVVFGYYFGLCDANMVIYTSTNTQTFIKSFVIDHVITTPDWFSDILFFAIPKVLVMLGIVPIVVHLNTVIDNKINELVSTQNTIISLSREMVENQRNTIVSLATLIEGRDQITGNHIKNTASYVEFLIKKLNEKNVYSDILTKKYSELVIDVAPLHDIGKVHIQDSILCKTDHLTDEEYIEMKKHPEYGYEILSKFIETSTNHEYLEMAKEVCLYHHERYDGKGYPNGLKGEEIPLCARIMAVADVLDALLTKRQYKEAFSLEQTYDLLSKESSKQFDPLVLQSLLDNWEEFKEDIYIR